MAAEIFSDTSSSSSSSRLGLVYDVFLSFRGEDTRKKFTDHLYTALIHAGINTFRDDDELPRGEDISFQLLKAIEESKISIVVFSKGYASSRWCLDELAKILECKNTKGQIVLPIFYDIDASDFLKQTGNFAEAFLRHEDRLKEELEKVNRWRRALLEAGNLTGWDLQNVADGHESKFIQKIVKDVLNKLNRKYLNVATHPVGIDLRVKDMILLLNVGTNDIRFVGIFGMGGIGKTTIAKAVFNQLCDGFEGSSCLLNVKEISEQPNGLVQLQKQLLCDILKPKNLKIHNVDEGINLIKEKLHLKRVLVVFDDLDKLEQLNALVGERNWFGIGSRIIITTRDEQLLTQLEVDVKYLAKELSRDESIQLFSWHAFRETHPIEDYMELSNGVIDYVGGLPLALEVLGSYLFKRSISEWKSATKKLQKIPHHQIQRKLRLSFDTLDDDMVKGIFLDIACFFIGMDKEYVAKILDGRGFFSEIGISILIQRSLITISNQNEVRMHDLLHDMGREIIRESSPNHPGKRSRIWFHEDVLNVLKKHMGTEVVEGLMLDMLSSKHIILSTESFAKMRYLKLLQINAVHLTGSYDHLPKDLTWLCWHGCPLKSLLPNFELGNLTVLDLQCSSIKEVWKEIRFLNELKIINLSHSVYLEKTPCFLGLPSLERLILEGCTSLVEVHQSVGHLEGLVFLNLEGCSALKNLPDSICYLKSLQTLNICSCLKLEKLPENLGNMEALTELLAYRTAIKQLPSSIGRLKNLRTLSLCGYKLDLPLISLFSLFPPSLSTRSSSSNALLPASFASLSSLTTLDLSYCGLSEGAISVDLGSLSSLKFFDLSGNKFFNLPTSIGLLPKLLVLGLYHCTNLLSISGLPSSLRILLVYNCTSMERLSIQSKRVPDLFLRDCQKLVEIQCFDRVENKGLIYISNCNNLESNLLQAVSRGEHPDFFLIGSEVPDWFSHRADGSSISFYVPAGSDSKIQGLILWVVYAVSGGVFVGHATIRNKSSNLVVDHCLRLFPTFQDHSCISYIPVSQLPCATEGGEELEVSINITNGFMVKKCGVHLIVNESNVTDSQGILMPYTSLASYENFDDAKAEPGRDYWSNCWKFFQIWAAFDSDTSQLCCQVHISL